MCPDLTERMTAAEYLDFMGVGVEEFSSPPKSPPAPNKAGWHAKPTWYESPMVGLVRFKSKKEAIRARELDQLVAGGQVLAWWYEVPLYCGFDNDDGSPCRLYPDFKVLWADMSVTWEDTKGRAPAEDWALKAKAVRQLHGIEIRIL